MIHIGLYLTSEPYIGGAHQYSLSIIHALDSLSENEYKITAFYYHEQWKDILPNAFQSVLVRKSLVSRVFRKLWLFVDGSPEGRRRASLIDPLVRAINRSNCDLVIYPNQDAASYQTNKKSLSTIHDLMHRYESSFEEYQNGEYSRREMHYALMGKYASGILVDSEIGKEHVVESYGVDRDKIFVLPFVPPMYLLNAIDTDVKKVYDLPDKYIFYPAQFWEHKNHINLIEAVGLLRDRGIQVNVVLVGSKKNNYKKVVDRIEELGLAKSFYILGYVSNDDMASLYKSATVTAFMSFLGPTNIPPLEAMTLGSPLVCSNAYAMPEQVGNAAMLVDPYNPKDISNKLEIMYLDETVAGDCIQAGLDRIAQYGQDEFNDKLECYIKLVVSV